MFWPQIISICLKRGKQGQPGLRRRAIASRSLLVMLKFDGKAVAAALCAASAAFLPLGVQAQAAVGPHADLCKNNRSEEHTSELQSLMRNSYAVFCLKKKKQIKSQTQS